MRFVEVMEGPFFDKSRFVLEMDVVTKVSLMDNMA